MLSGGAQSLDDTTLVSRDHSVSAFTSTEGAFTSLLGTVHTERFHCQAPPDGGVNCGLQGGQFNLLALSKTCSGSVPKPPRVSRKFQAVEINLIITVVIAHRCVCVCARVCLFPSARPGSAEISPNNPMPPHVPILHTSAQLSLGV